MADTTFNPYDLDRIAARLAATGKIDSRYLRLTRACRAVQFR